MALNITLRKLKQGNDGTRCDTYYATEGDWTIYVHVPSGNEPVDADVHFEFEPRGSMSTDTEKPGCRECGGINLHARDCRFHRGAMAGTIRYPASKGSRKTFKGSSTPYSECSKSYGCPFLELASPLLFPFLADLEV